MKPAPPPHIPRDTQAERFDNAVRKMFSVSTGDFLKQEEKEKRAGSQKKRVKKPPD
jgi:hypothetical protein